MTFADLQRQMECCQSYFTNMSMKAYIYRMYGYYTTRGYLICIKFRTRY